MSTIDEKVAAFHRYRVTREELQAARNLHNYAGAALELATIRDRVAELGSQHDPLASMLAAIGINQESPEYEKLRDFGNAVGHFILTGRAK